jgi:hypothetical protein
MTRAADHTLDRVGRCERLTETIGEACLPIVLAPVPPDEASRGIEGWILRREDGTAERIVVYSGSDVFRCASDPDRLDYQCLLKLASIIVHEAWHYRHGPREAGAYDRQIAFLTAHHGSSAQITGVRLARARVLAAQHAIALRQDLTRTLDGELRRP